MRNHITCHLQMKLHLKKKKEANICAALTLRS